MLAVPSYDAPFWGDFQWRQQSWLIPTRAVENRRWIVRSTSFGISQIIDPTGRTTAACRLEEPGNAYGGVGQVQRLSHYTRWGWLLPHMCIAIVAAIVWADWKARRRTLVPSASA